MDIGLAIARALLGALEVFRLEATAGWLFALMAAACVALCAVYYARSAAPPLRALSIAQRSLATVRFAGAGAGGDYAEREQRLDEAVAEAAARSRAGRRIQLAWRRRLAALHGGRPGGEDAIVTPAAVLGPQPRWLSTAADGLVGMGLVFTFLGLVAALGAASAAVAAEGDGRSALLGLLGAASVKFFTSIAGIGGALVMRTWQAYWLARIATGCAAMSDALDAHLFALEPEAR